MGNLCSTAARKKSTPILSPLILDSQDEQTPLNTEESSNTYLSFSAAPPIEDQEVPCYKKLLDAVKKTLDSSAVKKIVAILDSPPANLLRVISGVQNIPNGVMSIYPDVISPNQRLRAVSGLGCSLYAISIPLAAFLKKAYGEESQKIVSTLYDNIAIFANNFNFAFDTSCRIMGEIFTGVYANDSQINIGISIIIALCLAYAGGMAYRSNLAIEPGRIYAIAQAFSSTLAIGSLVSGLEHIQSFSMTRQEKNYYILGAQGLSLIPYTVIRIKNKHQSLSLLTQRLTLVTNILRSVVILLEAIEYDDPASQGLSSLFLFMGTVVAFVYWWQKPEVLKAFGRRIPPWIRS